MLTRNILWLNKFWPFTIKVYAFGFIIVMSLVFGFLGWGMQYKLENFRNDANIRTHKAALDEINYVLSHITNEINHIGKSIASQDETLQQFFNRDYYHYWRDNRIMGTATLPEYVQAIELYTTQGYALAKQPIGNMPKRLPGKNMGNYVARHAGLDFLFIFYPVTAPDTKSIEGYIGFKVELLDAVRNEQRFSNIDINTLSLNIGENEHFSFEQIISRLKFVLVPNAENIALTTSIEKSQRQILFAMIALYFVFYLMLTSVLSAPLRRLSLHIDSLRNGQGGLLTKNYTRNLPLAELEKVRNSLNDYQTKLEEMHLSLNEKNNELWQLAHHDPLTGIYNRRGFEEDWKHMLSVSSGHRLGVALLLFDCDHFKAINDTYGHPVGDKVLQVLTHTLQTTLRHGDRLYRIGGDEFATLFLDIEASLALNTAERCIEAVSKYDFTSIGILEPVRISAGMAYANGTDVDLLSNLPKQADAAMYHAKRPGKSKIAVFEQSMLENTDILFSNRINSQVFNAIENDNSIEMHYQPIANLNTGEIDYYEALVRIRDGDNLIIPATIFPIIAERRLESEFDIAVLGRITKDIKMGKIPQGKGITFNISGPGLVDPFVLEKINLLDVYLDKYTLILEITETALITQLHLASGILNKLRQKGFKIALDDFGSGYSSLSYLSNMPVDCVKFDITLIKQLFEGTRQSAIIEILASMILKAGYELVAEGVETEEILVRIRKIGFTRGQGFLLGRPEGICSTSLNLPLFKKKK